MAKILVNSANHSVDITTSISFICPSVEGEIPSIDRRAYIFDIIGVFSTRIIESIQRRQQACLRNLFKNLDNIDYNDGMHIAWHKDEKWGQFNVTSYQVMNEAIANLKRRHFEEFLDTPAQIDQTIKAFLNDPEIDRKDAGGFKFSELVSLLCEVHLFKTK